MEQKVVIIEKKGECGFLILNCPEAKNRLNEEAFAAISQALMELNADNEVRLIIVKSVADDFCMGGDTRRIVELKDIEEARNFFQGLIKMYKTFHRVDKIVIAMVDGYCTSGGFGVALSCDLIVASEDAKFGSLAVNVGLMCLNTSGVMLPRIVGSKKALEMALIGEVLSGKEMERLGVVNVVVPRARLEQATMELAEKILSKNSFSITLGKRNFYTCADMEYNKGLDHSAEMFAALAITDEAKKRMRAFLEKSEHQWQYSARSQREKDEIY